MESKKSTYWCFFYLPLTEYFYNETMRQIKIPYHSDSSYYYERIRHLDWPVFIDSCFQPERPKNPLVRYDLLTGQPFKKIIEKDGCSVLLSRDDEKTSSLDPSVLLKKEMENLQINDSSLPFTGGAIGFLAYEKNNVSSKNTLIPKFHFGIYDWAITVDHFKSEAFIVSAEMDSNTLAIINDLLIRLSEKKLPYQSSKFLCKSSLFSKSLFREYEKNFKQVNKYLIAGDCYQVNLSLKWQVETEGDSWDFYKKFRSINQSPFMAYLAYDNFEILSGSPERFITCEGRNVITRPIKGTKPRGSSKDEDVKNKDILINSKKDQAENLMIVDLLRNDLGINCETGSISVEELFKLEIYPNVYHLVSTISGKLKKDSTVFDLFFDAFPGGSITGAPKKRAMEVIDELENHARDFYCGSVAIFSFNNRMDSNIGIRSMVHKDNLMHIYSGGGLTIASDAQDEYAEIMQKLGNIQKTIEYFNGQL